MDRGGFSLVQISFLIMEECISSYKIESSQLYAVWDPVNLEIDSLSWHGLGNWNKSEALIYCITQL